MSFQELARHIRIFLKTRFSLNKDKEDEPEIVESLRRNVEFRGINVWVLIFAIFLASIGLNVNSTAVIIGAMLISPLMGPIMGIGLGLGIFDFDLLKSAAKNLAIMVVLSLATSTLYFSLSPLNQAQSELLARTTPTIWDVLIALFGGLAGIIAGASKEKGNAIPGVAIATALMPPLCTAGFGLARGEFYFFLGAFYLFCINAVFISVSTFIVVRLLRFKKHTYVDKKRERKIRNAISAIVAVTVIPSLFIAYLTVRKAVFEQRAQEFVKNEFRFNGTFALTPKIDYENDRIDVVLLGEPLPADTIARKKERLDAYGLSGTSLQVTQGMNDSASIDLDALRTGILNEVYTKNTQVLDEKDKIILELRNELAAYKSNEYPVKDILRELKTMNSNAGALSIQRVAIYRPDSSAIDTITAAYALFRKRPAPAETRRIEQWLKVRTKSDTLKLIIETPAR